MKPNFLGIGSVRGGSTWLHHVLSSHPDFDLPTKRKEVQFFTKHWERGPEWYSKFFADCDSRWIGEITPGYLVSPDAPERIRSLGGTEKFLLILRNPVTRFISHYRWHLRVTGSEISVVDFKEKLKRISIDNGLYCRNLKNFLRYFGKEQFLILIFENAVSDPSYLQTELSAFFNVDANGFAETKPVNQGIVPQHRHAFRVAHKAMDWCRRRDLDWIPNLAIRLGGKRLLEGKAKHSDTVRLITAEKKELFEIYKPDIEELEALLQRDLSIWKSAYKGSR